MIKAVVPQQSSDLVAVDIMADFAKFLRLHTADGDTSPETIRSYYGNAAQFVEATCLEGLQPVLARDPKPGALCHQHGRHADVHVVSLADPMTIMAVLADGTNWPITPTRRSSVGQPSGTRPASKALSKYH